MKSMDADALRVQKLGSDEAGNTYWYFYGTRLYKEEALEEKKSWNEEWNKQKKQSFKKRGRGRPRKVVLNSEGECDDFDDSYKKNDGYMNVSEKSRWSVVCDTIEEWVNFAEKFKDSKSKDEKNLFLIIQENFLPTLNKIYEEKEKKLQQKIRELMPAREKIITRRETRKMRGEVIESPFNGYEMSDEAHKVHMVKDRARRLEERNKRASEGESYTPRKRVKNDAQSPEAQSIDKDGKATLLQKTSGQSMDLQCQVERLMSSVKLHKDAWPFLYAVNEEDAPAYYDIIKEPVDLSLIESRLFEGTYETIGDLDADFDRMVSNCELYNGEYHDFSDMARTLRKIFRKGLAKILESFPPEELAKAVESEESRDSNYQSSSSSSSPPREVSGIPPKHHKKRGEKRKKGRIMDALELLAHASDLAVQNSNSNDMLNVYVHDEEKKSNDFPSLKILPIHSHPLSVVEKFSSSAPKESTSENNNSNENCSTYVNQEVELDGHYVRSSPGSTDIDDQYMRPSPTVNADNGGQSINSSPTSIDITGQFTRSSPTNIDINGQYTRSSPTNIDINGQYIRTSPGSAANESPNYINNLSHFTNLIEKNGTKNFNVLSNTDVTNALSESSPNHETNDNTNINDSSNASKVMNSENLHSLDNIHGFDNFISNIIKQPTYDSGVVLQSKDSVSPSYAESFPHQNLNISKNKGNSSPTSSFLGQVVTDNMPLIQDINLSSLGNSPSHLTTIDASVLDMQYNPFSKNSKNQDVPQNQNSSTNPNVIPNLAHEGVFSKNNSYRPKERTPPSLANQYYPQQQSSSILSCDPSVSVPMTYPSLNLVATTSGHTAFVQTLTSNSTSNIPLQIPVPCPKPMLSQQQQQQQPKIQFQLQQDNSGVRVPVPEQNSHLFVVPEVGKGPVTTYHMFTQNKPNQNVVENHNNHLRNGITAANQMPPNSQKRIIENQDNYTKQGSPHEKKSPPAQHIQTYVPLTNMPYHPASTSASNISKISLPVTSSNFMPVSSVIQGAKKNNHLSIRTSVADVENRTTSAGNTTSFNTISSTNTSNTLPQSNFQALNTQSVPVIFSGYNQSSDQMDSRLKNNPTVTMQSNVGVSNGVPIVQKVLIPQIQYANNGQFLFTSPQNTVRLISKEQNVQVQNNVRQMNPNFGKVVPQIVTPTTLMSGLQLQAVAPNNAQAFNQVSQNPQFVSIPTFMLSNHNTLQNTQQSSPPSVMNLQPFQLAQRQMHLNGPGNN